MNDAELKDVFRQIHEQTCRNALKWKPGKDQALRVDFARSSVEVSRSESYGVMTYSLRIYNNVGAVIARVDDNLAAETGHELRELYENAYDSAYEVGSTLKDVLAGLAPTGAAIRPGIYRVNFVSPSTADYGDGVVVIADGKINGGDKGFIYRGRYEVRAAAISGTLNAKQWNPSVPSVFGNAPPTKLVSRCRRMV